MYSKGPFLGRPLVNPNFFKLLKQKYWPTFKASWVQYIFHAAQLVTSVEITPRLACNSSCKRYKNVCFALIAASGKELEKKCTTGLLGEPYLKSSSSKQIKVPFTTNEMVKTLKITFSENYGQISEIFIEGSKNIGLFSAYFLLLLSMSFHIFLGSSTTTKAIKTTSQASITQGRCRIKSL